MTKYRRQMRIQNRTPKSAELAPHVMEFLEKESDRYKVSVPFIISVALEDYFRLKHMEEY